MNCQAAEEVLQLLLAGAPVGEDELREAQAHLESCPICAARYEGRPRRWAFLGRRRPLRKPKPAVEPAVLVERALIGALSDPETIVRARAAEALAVVGEPGDAAISALLETSLSDSDEEVRNAARAAFQLLFDRGLSREPAPPSAAREKRVLRGGNDISGQAKREEASNG